MSGSERESRVLRPSGPRGRFDPPVPTHLADAGLIRPSPGGWERNMFLSEILWGFSAPHPELLFARAKSNQKHARREKPFRWGFSPVTPSSATTQRGARVGTSSASLILPQAAGFARCAAPPSSSANAALVCLGAAPSGLFFTDSRWINPVRQGKCLAGLVGLGENPKRGLRPPRQSIILSATPGISAAAEAPRWTAGPPAGRCRRSSSTGLSAPGATNTR